MDCMEELAIKAAKGDKAAFDRLYTLTRSGVWYTCISLLKNEENAKDIMQDTYLTAYEKLAELRNPASVQSWLNRIAANKCRNYLTAWENKAAAEDGEEILEDIPDDLLLPDEYVTDKAKRKIIMDIIRDVLSEEQYRTVVLYYFDEMNAAEIAQLMGCHEKTVLYRLKTARMKIKEGVMRYEKENKDKLYGVIPVVFLARLLKAEADNPSATVPAPDLPSPLTSQQMQPSQPSPQPNEDSFKASQKHMAKAVKNGGKRMFNSLKSKIIIGACAASVTVGTAAAVIAVNSGSPAAEPPIVTAGTQAALSETAAPPASTKPANTAQIENTAETTQEPTPAPDTITLSDEIVNAPLDSCLVQINNYVIKQGGYMTVAEFVEAYGDRCTFSYQQEPYEETKDYLIPYLEDIQYSDYFLEVVPEVGSPFRIAIANCTSPDEKITVDKAIVIKCENFASIYKSPIWSPKGWGASGFSWHANVEKYDLVSTNKEYSLKDFPSFLESEGIEEYVWDEGSSGIFPPCTPENCKKYVRGDTDDFAFYVAGETNLFGARPVFKYWIFFSPDTEKIQDEIESYELVGFFYE